jgi:uncharacterized protein (DUF885 family)
MKALIFYFKHILLLFLICSTSVLFAQTSQNNVAFNKLLNDYFEEGLSLDPLTATQIGDNRFNDLLPNDISVPHLQKLHNYNTKYQKLLAAFKKESLNSFDKISFDILTRLISEALEREQFHFEYIPINQQFSLPNAMPSLGSGNDLQPFKTVKDYNNWLKRMDGFVDWVDTAIANCNKGIAIGMVLPKALVVKIIPQLEAQTITDTAKNIFYEPIKNMPKSFSENEKSTLRLSYQNAISKKIVPAYQKLADYLKNTYLPKARVTSGINGIPNGEAMYQYLIKIFTTTNKTPEEIYQIGLKEVDRITKEIETLKIKVGFVGDLTAFYNYTISDKQFFPFSTEDQVLDSYRAIYPKIEPSLKKLFNLVPKAAFEVRAIEKFKAASTSANYQTGSEDGSRPGYFNVPIIDAAKYNKNGMEVLFLHEAIPGHHFQLSLQQENKNLPKLRKFTTYSVFSEGWGLYTESLGEELGLYKDPYQKLGALKLEMLRAIRLVTDVGLHTGKMTREESIKYMLEKGGSTERGAISATERYMANPGQAVSYKIGQFKIIELKSKYKKSLGSKFNIKSFHDAILLGGSMPLTTFETYMDEWAITQNK